MSKQETGGPAFPAPDAGEEHFSQRSAYMGMPLRDYFAAKAFAVLVQAHVEHSVDDLSKDIVAHESYSYADAMLKARQP